MHRHWHEAVSHSGFPWTIALSLIGIGIAAYALLTTIADRRRARLRYRLETMHLIYDHLEGLQLAHAQQDRTKWAARQQWQRTLVASGELWAVLPRVAAIARLPFEASRDEVNESWNAARLEVMERLEVEAGVPAARESVPNVAVPPPTGDIPRDRGVEVFVGAVTQLQRRLSPYRPFIRRWRRRFPSGNFAYAYVAGWLAIEFLAFGVVGLTTSRAVAVVASALCAYRFVLLILWYLHFLFDWDHQVVVGAERNLLLLLVNFGELTVIGGVLIASAASLSAGDAWLRAFSILTLSSFARGGFWIDASTVALTSASLLLVAGGLAVILSNVSRKFRFGDHEGPS